MVREKCDADLLLTNPAGASYIEQKRAKEWDDCHIQHSKRLRAIRQVASSK